MQKFFVYCFTVICLTLAGVLLFSTPTHADVLFTGDYEVGSFTQWPVQQECCSYSQQIVTSPIRAGKYAARFELHKGDPLQSNGKRTEVRLASGRFGQIGGADDWYGFSIYLPESHVNDTFPMNYIGLGAFEILAQWHTEPDNGEVGRNPPLFLVTDGGQWKFVTRHSGTALQQDPTEGATVIHALGSYKTEVWTDFVVNVRWSCRDAKPLAARCQSMPQGFLRVWKDGKQVVNYTGPTAYNDHSRVFWKAGIYKGMWKHHSTHVSQRVVYHDEFRIGDSTSSYAEVAPRSSTRDTTPPASPSLLITAIPAQK